MTDAFKFKVTMTVVNDDSVYASYNAYPANIARMNEWCVDEIGPKGLSWGLVFKPGARIAVYEFATDTARMMFLMCNR